MACTGRGFNSYFTVKEETAYGTPIVGIDSDGTLISETMAADFAYEVSPGLGSRNVARLVQGPKSVAGDIVFEVNYEGVLGWLLKQTFGQYSVAGTTEFTHTFDMASENTLPTGLTVRISKGDITAGNMIEYQGSKVSTLTLAFQSSGIVQGTVGLVSQDEATGVADAAPPVFSSDHVLWSDFKSSSVSVAGVSSSSIPVQSGTLVVENNVEPRFLMDTLTSEPCMTARRRVSGTLVCEFPDIALLDEFHVGSQNKAFDITWESAITIPGGGSLKFTLKVTTADGSLIMSNATNVGGEGPVIATIGYEVFNGLLTLINSEATYGTPIA